MIIARLFLRKAFLFLPLLTFITPFNVAFAQEDDIVPITRRSKVTKVEEKKVEATSNFIVANSEENQVSRVVEGVTWVCTYGDCQNGFGTLVDAATGNFYSGLFKDGKLSGPGIRDYGKDTYIGIFSEDFRDGPGFYNFGGGGFYLGFWIRNVQNSHGMNLNKEGYVIAGDFKNGSTPVNIAGAFNGGKENGTCIGDCLDTFGNKEEQDGSEFMGLWKNGKYHHYGMLTYQNGDIYSGEFIDGRQDGFGVLKTTDGEIYYGNFKDGYRDGYGVYLFSDKRIMAGMWERDGFIKKK